MFWYLICSVTLSDLSTFATIALTKRQFVVLLLSCICQCSESLSHSAMDLSVICDF